MAKKSYNTYVDADKVVPFPKYQGSRFTQEQINAFAKANQANEKAYYDKLNSEWSAYRDEVFSNKNYSNANTPKDTSESTLENIWNGLKDAVGLGKDYEKAEYDYHHLFRSNDIIQLDQDESGFKLKHFDNQKLEQLYLNELNKILPPGESFLGDMVGASTKMMTNIQSDDDDESSKFNDWGTRLFSTALRSLLPDEKSERVSALIDKYLEIENIGRTLQKRKDLLGDDKNLLDLKRNQESLIGNTLGKATEAATRGLIDFTGISPNQQTKLENKLYNVFNYFHPLRNKNDRPEGYVSWSKTHEAVNDLMNYKISMMPDGPEKEQAKKDLQEGIEGRPNLGYWERFAPEAADLLGSIFSPTGEFSLALKGANVLVNKGKAAASVAAKWSRAEKLLSRRAKEVDDLAKSLQSNPSMMNRAKLLWKGINGKNLAMDDVTVQSIKGFVGSGTESMAKMTIASGIMNALDQGMTDSEAWDATVNMGLLVAGNEVAARMMSRVARGFKLFNATTATLENPIAFAKDMEKIYAGAMVVGQSLSQGANSMIVQDISPLQQEFWGEQLTNAMFAGKEFRMGYESARASKYAKNNPEVNRQKYETKLVDENFDIGSVSDNAVFHKETVVKPNGESEEMTYVSQRKDTPANIIEREARAKDKNLNDLTPRDILELLPEQHQLENPAKQKLLERMIDKVGDVKVKIADVGTDSYAKYRPKERAIYFNNNLDAYNANYETVYSGLQEEVTHALTVEAYDKNKKVKEAIDRQYEKAKELITPEVIKEQDPIMQSELEYYLSNPHEYMALFTNRRLQRTKEFVLKQLGNNPNKGIKGALKRFMTGDKYEQEEFDAIFTEIFDSKPIEAPEQELNTQVAETMGQENNSSPDANMEQFAKVGEFPPESNPLDDLFLSDDPEYGNPLLKKLGSDTDTKKQVGDLINKYNERKTELGFNDKQTTAFDFINDATKQYGKDYTLEDLKSVIEESTSRLEKLSDDVDAKFNLLKNIENTDKEVYDKIIDNKVKLNEVFGSKNTLQILNRFAGQPVESIKKYIQDNVNKLYNDIPAEHIDLISDNIAARISQIRQYPTLKLTGTSLESAPSSYKGRPVVYFDTEAGGYKSWAESFTMDQSYSNSGAKELMTDILSRDLQAIALAEVIHEKEVDGNIVRTNAETNINRTLEGILSDRKETLSFIQENIVKGYYIAPRGMKGLTVIESPLLREIAGDNEKANRYAQLLEKYNFYHWLDSDATWGYDPSKPNIAELSKYIKHSELHRQSVGGLATDYTKLASKPDYVEVLKQNADAIEMLKTKTVQYYKDAEGKTIGLSHLFEPKYAKLNLYNAITSTMQWGLDPSGESRTLKYNPETGDSKLKKLVSKYEGVWFGRHNGQINKEEMFRKFLPEHQNLTEDELVDAYSKIGLHYENGELYQKTLIVDPEVFKDTMLSFINDKSTDGSMIYSQPELAKFYNKALLNPENSALIKPRLHFTDEFGNSLMIKSASFNLPIDKHTEVNNPVYHAYMNNIKNKVGVITFNSASKSGHTRKAIRVPSTLKEGSYVLYNANRQIVNAETNGKADPELLKAEQQRYIESIMTGNIDDAYVVKLPITGKNPLQFIDFSHSISDFDDAGAIGIDKNPLFHPEFDLFKGEEGQQAFSIFNEMFENVINKNVSLMEDYALLRTLTTVNGDNAVLKTEDLTDAQLQRAGKALKGIMKRIAKMKDSEDSWDAVNNIGLDNFKMLIADSVDKKGRLKKEMLLPLLTIDRLLAGQQGTNAGTGSVLFNAMKYAYDDAAKVRLPGRKGLVVPDLQSSADISRLAEYEAKKAENSNIANEILEQASYRIAEYTDPQTGVYKDYSLGVSLGLDIIESLGLKSGDRIFLKLTPSDDLHSIVPAIVTGMTAEGGIAYNTKYMTEIIGRDFDKDGLQVVVPGKGNDRILSDEKFDQLWDFYVKNGMHTGKYKSGNEQIEKESNTLINNVRQINNRFGYKKHRMFPQEPFGAVDFIQAHSGQGAGIGQRNKLGTFLIDFLPKNRQFTIGDKKSYQITLRYPKDDQMKLAAEANILTQASVDTYNHQPFNRNYEYNKLFIESINYFIDDKQLKPLDKNNLDEAQKKGVNKEIGKFIKKAYGNRNDITSLQDFANQDADGFPVNGRSSTSMFHDRLNKSNMIINDDLEKTREVLLKTSNDLIIDKITDSYKNYEHIKPINKVIKTLLDATETFYKPIKNSTYRIFADEAFTNIKAFTDPNPKPYMQEAKGIYYNELVNVFPPHTSNFIIDRVNNVPIQYQTDGIKGYVEYKGKRVELSKIFSEDGALQFTELLDSPRVLDERLHKTIQNKGFSDSEKSRLMGKIIGNTAKRIANHFQKDAGEIASIIAFTKIENTTLGLPSPDGKNAITGKRIPELANVEAGIRSMGVIPKVGAISPQAYIFDVVKNNSELIYSKTKDTDVASIVDVQPESDQPAELGMPIITNKANKLSDSSLKKYLRDKTHYSQDLGYTNLEYQQILESNKEFRDNLLLKLGYDPNKASNDTKKILGYIYDDYTKSIFPESKVNKIVYHGTSNEFNDFDKAFLGKYTGSASAKQGFFFSGNIKTSINYSKEKISIKDADKYIDESLSQEIDIDNINSFEVPGKEYPIYITSKPYKSKDDPTFEPGWDDVYRLAQFENGDSNYPYNQESLTKEELYKKYGKYLNPKTQEMSSQMNTSALMGWDIKADSAKNIKSAVLDIKNPFIYDYKGSFFRDEKYVDLIKQAKELGHDGVILKRTYDPSFTDVYVVFEPEQIHTLGDDKDLENFNKYYNKESAELGMPVLRTQKAKNIASEVMDNIAKELKVDRKDLNIRDISNEQWNGIIKNVIKPDLYNRVRAAKLMSDDDIDSFVNDATDKLTSGAINTYLQRKEFISQLNNPNIKKDADGNIINSKAINFVNKTIKGQFLTEYLTEVERIERGTTDSKYAQFRIFNTNAKDMIVNANASNIAAYNANDIVYPTFVYKNGSLEKQENEITNQKEDYKRYMTVGNLFDRRMQSNRLFQIASKDWIEKVLPLKRQGYLNDSVKSLSKNLNEANLFSKTDLETIDTYSNITKQYYYDDLKAVLGDLSFDRLFENEHKYNKVVYKTENTQDLNDLDAIIELMKQDFVSREINPETGEPGFEDDRASLFDSLRPFIQSYIKTTSAMKQHADYVRAAKDNIEFISKARVTDPQVESMLKQEIVELENLIADLENPSPDKHKYLTRKMKLTDAEALDIIQTHLVNPRKAAVDKRDALLKQLDWGKNELPAPDATEDEILQLNIRKAASREAMGHLKTQIERAIKSGQDPDFNTIMNKTIEPNLTIRDGLLMFDRDPMETFNIMKSLVDHNNNEMGDYYRLLQKLDPNENAYWEQMTGAERKSAHDKVVNKINNAIDRFKNQLSVESKAVVYFGETPFKRLKDEPELPIEDLIEIVSPKANMFDYSIDNLNEKVHKKLMKATYSIQKAMNIEYAKSPDANQLVDNILLGEFVSATGGEFHYNKVHDRSSINELRGMVYNGMDIGIDPGKPVFALYLDNGSNIRQSMGRFVGTFRTPVYDSFGSVVDYVPYITLIDDAGVTSRTYTMPFSRINTLVTGDHHNKLMRSHNDIMKSSYQKFADKVLPALKEMTAYKEEVYEAGTAKRLPLLSQEQVKDAKLALLSDQVELKEELTKPSLPKLTKNVLGAHMDATVISLYGYAGSAIQAGVGLGTMFVHPFAGLGMLGYTIMKTASKFGKAWANNTFGTSAAYRTMPYLPEQNLIVRGIKAFKNSVTLATNAAGNRQESETGRIISGAKLAALSASNDAKTQLQYLVGEDMAKITESSPWTAYKESKRLTKEKQALEEIERFINKKYASTEIDKDLLRAGDEYMNKLLTELEEKGNVEIIDNKIFINGKGYNQYKDFKYNLLDVIKNVSMLKGFMADQELTSYANALRNNEASADYIIDYLRKTSNEEVVKFDHNTFADFLIKQTEISIGYYDKTPSQRSAGGRILNTFSQFGKESLMNSTQYRMDRQARTNAMIEVMGKDKEFVEWLENKNGVPIADFATRNEKSQTLMELMILGVAIGTSLWIANGGAKALSNAFGVDENEEVKQVKDDVTQAFLSILNIDKTAAEAVQLGLTGATDIMIEPRGNSKKGSKEISHARNVISRPGGYGQNIALEMFTSLGIAGIWQLYTMDKDEKWQRSADRTMEDQIVNAKANATAFILPGTRDIFKEIYKPEKEVKPKATRRKRIPKE